jgi:hypothetical protein
MKCGTFARNPNDLRWTKPRFRPYAWYMLTDDSSLRRVKLFRNGRNQAVRIPREFELPGEDGSRFRSAAEVKPRQPL